MMRTLLPLGVLLVACGARTGSLDDATSPWVHGAPPPGQGAGGGGSGGVAGGGAAGGGASGAGGAGGASGSAGAPPVVCPSLDSVFPALPVEVAPGTSQIELALTSTSDDGQQVGFGLVDELPSAPVGPMYTQRLGGFAPWQIWPTTPLGTAPLGPSGPSQSVVGYGAGSGTLSVAGPTSPSPPSAVPSGLFFLPSVSTQAQPTTGGLSLGEGAPGQVPLFIQPGLGGHLLGHEPFWSGHTQLDLAFAVGGPSLAWSASAVGCATSPLVADAAKLPDQSMVVGFSTSRPFGDCLLDDGVDGPPSKLLLARWQGLGHDLAPFGPELSVEGDSLAYLRVLPALDGVWVALRYAGDNALVQPPPDVMRLTAKGKVVLGPTPVAPSSAGALALAPFGDGLIVAYEDTAQAGALRVQVLDAKLGLVVATEVAHPPGMPHGKLSLVAAPSGVDALLGWTQAEAAGDRAYVARLSCFFPD